MFMPAANGSYTERGQFKNYSTFVYPSGDFSADLKLRDPLYVVVPLTVLYSFILVAGIIGNVVSCWVIVKIKCMHTTTNYYLFSLSVSDLILLTSGLPQEIYLTWHRYPYIFGETFCVLRGLAAEMSANATVLTITAFSIERYIAICHPFLACSVSNQARVTKLILTIWLLALLSAIPQALQFGLVQSAGPETLQCTLKRIIIPHSFELSTLFFFVIPMIVISILYAMIGIKMNRSNQVARKMVCRSLHIFSTSSANTSRSSMFNQRPPRKPLSMLVAVVVTFFVCWAPFHAQRLIAIYGTGNADNPVSDLFRGIYDAATYTSAILYYTSTMVNPVIYQITCRKFREAFRETVGSFRHKAPKNGNSR